MVLGLFGTFESGSLSAADADAPSASAAAVAADPMSEALLATIAKAAAGTTTVVGACEWRTTKQDQDEPQALACTFALQAPDRYNIVETDATKSGWKKRLCSDGQRQWEVETTFAGVKPDVTDGKASPDSDLNRLFACLRGDTTRPRQRNVLTATAAERGGTTIALAPKPGLRTDLVKGAIVVDAQGHVQSLSLTLDGGQRVDVRITAATYGGAIAPATFQGPPADR